MVRFLFLLFICSIPFILKDKKSYLLIITYSIYYGFREGIGVDYFAYEAIFNNINEDFWVEPAYGVLNILFYPVGFKWLNFFIGLMTIYLIFRTLKNYFGETNFRKYISYSILIFLFAPFGYGFYVNGVRQAIAMTLFFYGYLNLNQKVKYLFYALASLFHLSSLFIIPFFIIAEKKISNKIMLLSVLISLIVWYFKLIRIPIVYLLNFTPYAAYVNEYLSSVKTGTGIVFILNISLLVIILFHKKNILDHKIKNLIFFNLVFKLLFYDINLIYRMSFYFDIFLILIIPLWYFSVMKITTKSHKLINNFVFVLFYLVQISFAFINPNFMLY
jgi:hypothetical protein